MGNRVNKSIKNIKVGVFFYVLSLVLAFFSRKIFLDCLGPEFIGLTGMLQNIMNYLGVAELGIGTSIIYFLYKPLQEDNHEKINEIMSMLAYLYRCIGFIIGGGGFIISLFFPFWFSDLSTGLFLVYFAFYSFLASSMMGYIFNFRQLLVSANQKQYVVSGYFQTIAIVQSLTQIILAYLYQNLYLWVCVGLFYTIIGCIVFNRRIRREYPWLKVDLKQGRQNLKNYPEILKKTRQIFVQKFKDLFLYRSDEILVGAFVSVTHVAFYGNYTMITYKLIYLINILSDGLSAGVGNLLAEGNEKNTMKVFWEMTTARVFITGIVIFSLIMYIQPFIAVWVGPEYQLSMVIIYLLIFHLFIYLHNMTVYIFIGASGLYGDIWAAWLELAVNVAVTFSLAPYYGIAGILLGKIISVFFITTVWKPYYLFSRTFKRSFKEYVVNMGKIYLIFAFCTACAVAIKYLIIDPSVDSLLSLILYGIMTAPPLIFVFFMLLFLSTNGMKYFVARKPAVYYFLCRFTRLSSASS